MPDENTVVSSLVKCTVTAKLNNGMKDDTVQTVNVSLPTCNIDRYNDQKAMNIVNLLAPCLSKSVYKVTKTEVSDMTNSD